MPRLYEESFGTGDQSWLGSAHGIWNCRTETLGVDQFTAATHYPDGYIPSGTPLAKVLGVMIPYNSAGTGEAAVLAGFLFTDFPVKNSSDTEPVPVLDHGRVKADKVPGDFTAPTDANNATTVVFI